MARKQTDNDDKAKGKRPRRNGFLPAQREKFVDLIRRGSTFRNACRLVGISHDAAYRWLRVGREGGRGCTAAHKAFVRAYEEAEADGVQDLLDQMISHAKEDYRATKALLEVRDSRFGVRRSVSKANLAKLQAEVKLAEANARLAEAKAAAAEKALKSGGQTSLVLGVAAILQAPELSQEIRDQIARVLNGQGAVAIGARDFEAEARERDIA